METIRVPAGEFFTFVMEITESSIGGGLTAYERKDVVWYAPEVGARIKGESVVTRSMLTQGQKRAYELVSVKFPGGAAPPAAPQKPKLQVDCEAAQADKGTLAAFMQSLPRDTLTKYLEAGQACTAFR